jgi:hypothetical protein
VKLPLQAAAVRREAAPPQGTRPQPPRPGVAAAQGPDGGGGPGVNCIPPNAWCFCPESQSYVCCTPDTSGEVFCQYDQLQGCHCVI